MIIKTENRSYYIVLHCVMDQPETRDELESVLESGMYLEPNAEIKVKLDRDIVCDDPMKYCNNIEIFAGHVTLDLAGHTIDFNAQQPKDYNYIFFINPQYEYGDSSTLGIYTTFTIEDSVGGGKITGGWNGTLGGAVSVGTPGTFNMTGGSITGNKAREGGAILNWGTVNLSNCTISDNTADRYGGAIYGGGTLNIGGGTVIENNSCDTYDGGAIYYLQTNGKITLDGAIIRNNTAEDMGAALHFSQAATTHGMGGQAPQSSLFPERISLPEIRWEASPATWQFGTTAITTGMII